MARNQTTTSKKASPKPKLQSWTIKTRRQSRDEAAAKAAHEEAKYRKFTSTLTAATHGLVRETVVKQEKREIRAAAMLLYRFSQRAWEEGFTKEHARAIERKLWDADATESERECKKKM